MAVGSLVDWKRPQNVDKLDLVITICKKSAALGLHLSCPPPSLGNIKKGSNSDDESSDQTRIIYCIYNSHQFDILSDE